MAIAPPIARPRTESGSRYPSKSSERDVPDSDAARESSPDAVLVSAILERSTADVGWLAWGDGSKAVVVPGVASSFLNPAAIGEFPEPPRESLVIDRGAGSESLDITYCRIAIRDAGAGLTIRAAGGHRPPGKPVAVTWPLADLKHCAQALHERRAVVLSFSSIDRVVEPERLALFSPTTRAGVILPFFVGPRTQGVLIIGEERRSRRPPMSPGRVAILELGARP